MGNMNLIEQLHIDPKKLDVKKQQTSYKIQFVTTYIKSWLYVNTNRDNIENIVFIDCMCNAGLYADGDLGTATQVFTQFKEAARLNPSKNFLLVLNDYSKDRMEICEKVINEINSTEPALTKNLTVYIANQDVNRFLDELDPFDKVIKRNAATVLFVDPYDFVTVNTETLKRFIMNYYCEVIYNFFSSDFVRNKGTDRIKDYLGVGDFNTVEDAETKILSKLKVGKMNYTFTYAFKNINNVELYRILFFTPNIAGLVKLKEALWATFKGKPFHRNESQSDTGQLSLFSDVDEKKQHVDYYANAAREHLVSEFDGKTLSYALIEQYLLQTTMMMDTHIIGNVIKPLINEGRLIKLGQTKVSYNFKKDSYTFKGSRSSANNN